MNKYGCVPKYYLIYDQGWKSSFLQFWWYTFYTILDWLTPSFTPYYCEGAQWCSWHSKHVETHQGSVKENTQKVTGTVGLTCVFLHWMFQWTNKETDLSVLIQSYLLTYMIVSTYGNR